ncbi:molybdotransferase-like divisome protein Glp [Actinokineospora globicatena]|uniref:Molybdopterin molybdenumtransferase n=1 Tax=Actinokineospora globicatena TaxID=103729 RepID=A0A9W6QN96_9PSEU|nr:gephyrin-like molybdotransferase Glp [Actinokineospora globicatena]MCP2300674.1 molybdopterin molybdotransferase [Actinokineospora globicatena]GLW81218.1 molybdopterin molybdenumtransferase [Actinokineospora globicatena]GLW89174.1 molybdopterin molybdenumtransferase [Actinokineospora globicatena]GLW92880.1 molybdopterin molybdenumtransferase [Actinokineospora globicatena]
MRSVDEQLARALAAAVRPAPVRVAISEAQGLLCAEEVVAERALPGFDQAAVDGYAVRSVDTQAAGTEPVVLPVVGEIASGSRQPRRLQPGQAVRVATGAPLPTLADAVVPNNYTDGHHARVTINQPVPSAAYVRRTGEDVQTGDVAVRRGSVIGSAQVGLLAAVGRSKVLVYPRPRVSVISLGDELVDIDRTPGQGQVYDVNSYALAAAGRDAGADVIRVGIVSTDTRRLRETVESRLLLSEIVVIAGGAGGDLSHEVRSALRELGEIDLTRVAMHPGSVQGFGRLGPDAVPTFLLPGNPMSALVVFEVMVRPLIRAAQGKRNPHRRVVQARLLSPITSTKSRRGYLRGQLLRDEGNGEYMVQPLGLSGSHLLASLAEANCLILVDEDTTEVSVGEGVQVLFLAQRG